LGDAMQVPVMQAPVARAVKMSLRRVGSEQEGIPSSTLLFSTDVVAL
jgi:hypothetical protein